MNAGQPPAITPFGHAVVIGGGIAGLTAARVLADHFNLVTVIERDQRAPAPAYRPGVPQARHAHTLQPRGQKILAELFPGLVEAMLAQGGVGVDAGEIAFFHDGAWRTPRDLATGVSIASSQPLLETTLFNRLTTFPNIDFRHGYDVTGLLVDPQGRRVTGVSLRGRRGAPSDLAALAADLVVDTGGRHSPTPRWLESLGFASASETVVDAQVGYATAIYRRPSDFDASWKKLYIRPTAPRETRGGIILPLEDGRWCVTLIGVAGDYPPTDPAGFLAFARSLPTPALYEAIRDAEPLTKPGGYRNTANRRRHYEGLPRYPEGFLVLGDAAYALNPIYAQGMTTAALGSMALHESVAQQKATGQILGLARRFQHNLDRAMAPHWRLATMKDRQWPATAVREDPAPSGLSPRRRARYAGVLTA